MNPILQALAAAGYQLLEADQAALEAAAAKVADDVIVNVANGLEAALSKETGVAGLVAGELKGIITAAEPALEGVAGEEIDTLYAALEAALKNASGPATQKPA